MYRLKSILDHLSSAAIKMKTTEHKLSPPPLEDIAKVLHTALESNYAAASVGVAQCPDLRKSPWHLAAQGLSGHECIADVGGQPHLFPRPQLDKKYSLLECAKSMQMSEQRGMLLGAGAGPFHIIGQNSELAPNLSWEGSFENVDNKSHYAKMDKATNGELSPICQKSPSSECALMMNLFGSSGTSGPVLKITARGRKGSEKSFTDCIRHALHDAYGDERQISMGGVFLLKKGKALYHIMPDFPSEDQLPFKDRHQLNDWLTYHNFPAPMLCLTVFHSCDAEKLGLRMEHTHCFSAEGKNEGGHYHNDILPEDGADEIEYEAYLNTAKTLYRIDKPEVTLKQDLHD